MIMINLLPHREERRKRRKVAYYAGLGVAALDDAISMHRKIGGGVIAASHTALSGDWARLEMGA